MAYSNLTMSETSIDSVTYYNSLDRLMRMDAS